MMNKKIAALALVALAALGLSACSSASPQERAIKTATDYTAAYFGGDGAKVQSLACSGKDIGGGRYDTIPGPYTVRGSEQKDDGTWVVTVAANQGDGSTPTVTPTISKDGSCVESQY